MQVTMNSQKYERLSNPKVYEENNDLYFSHLIFRHRYYTVNGIPFSTCHILYFLMNEYGQIEFLKGDKGFDSYDDMPAIWETIRTRV